VLIAGEANTVSGRITPDASRTNAGSSARGAVIMGACSASNARTGGAGGAGGTGGVVVVLAGVSGGAGGRRAIDSLTNTRFSLVELVVVVTVLVRVSAANLVLEFIEGDSRKNC